MRPGQISKVVITDRLQLAVVQTHLGAKYLGFFSPLVPSKREKNVLVCLVCIFFEGNVFTFQFLNDKIHNYVQKKHTSSLKYKVSKTN